MSNDILAKVIYNGKKYESYASLCRDRGINYSRFQYRIHAGYSVEDAVNAEYNLRYKKVTYKGVTYTTITDLCHTLNLNYNRIVRRLNSNWSLERAIESETVRSAHAKEVEYNGVKYYSIKELADSLGYDYVAFTHYVSRRNTIDEAVLAYNEKYNKHLIELWGKTYKSYYHLASSFGISVDAISGRLVTEVPLEDIVKELLNSVIEFKGKKYSSLTELCSVYNIHLSSVLSRLKSGWVLEEALTKKVDSSKGVAVEYRGKEYTSKMALCRDYGIGDTYVSDFLRLNNMSVCDWLFAFDLAVQFFDKLGGYKPNIISRVPLVIYNGVWLYTYAEFCNYVNVPLSAARRARGANTELTPFEALSLLNSEYDERYTLGGKVIPYKSIRSITGIDTKTAIKKGIVTKIKLKRYPNCMYQPDGYCVNVLSLFEKYKENKLSNYKTKKKV